MQVSKNVSFIVSEHFWNMTLISFRMLAVRAELGSPPNTGNSSAVSVTSFWLRNVATSLSQSSGESGNLVWDVSNKFFRSSTLKFSLTA